MYRKQFINLNYKLFLFLIVYLVSPAIGKLVTITELMVVCKANVNLIMCDSEKNNKTMGNRAFSASAFKVTL